MSKRVTHAHLAGLVTALALMSSPATAQDRAPNAAMMARRDSCYTAVTGDTAKLSARIAKATASGSTAREANQSVMAALDSTQRRAVMTCSRNGATMGRTTGTSGGDVNLSRARSQKRIPVSKEVGEGPVRDTAVVAVAPPPAPAPAPAPAPTPAPVVVDTATYTPAPVPVVVKHYGNWYIGFGAGTAVPTEEARQAYDAGPNFNVPIGWESPESVLGFRVNLGYSKFEGRTTFRSTGTTAPGAGSSSTARLALQSPQIYSGMADLTLRLPFLGTYGGPMTGLYLVGGAGFNKFTDWYDNFARTNPEMTVGNNTATKEAYTTWAANGGGGLRLGFGMADVFAEARYVSAFTPNHRTSYVPVLLGLALRY